MLVSRFQFPNTNAAMSLDPQNEYGNEPPQTEKLPFELLKNEAVITFDENGRTKYVKLENISQKETFAYPSTPPRGQ
jgi:hypothetical protein